MDIPTQRPTDAPPPAAPARNGRIVVGVDGSPGARLALAWALVAAADRGAELVVLSAFPVEVYWLDPYLVDPRRVGEIRGDTETRVRGLVEDVRRTPEVSAVPGTGEVAVQVIPVPGPAAPSLVHHAAEAELLVVGSRGRGGVRSTVLGSVALHCAAHANCPVVVVRPAPEEGEPVPASGPQVVVGLDDSPPAKAALVTALAEARRRNARVEAVLAYQQPDYWSEVYAGMTPSREETGTRARGRADALVSDALGDGRDAVDVTVVEGPAGEALVQRSVGAELLVVGSRSRSTLPGMVLGSVALHCVIHGPCPVMVVRPVPRASAARPSAGATTAVTG